MLDWISILIAISCLAGAVVLLITLSIIDLRVRLLPNRLVLPLAILGVIFHTATTFHLLSPIAVVLGGVLGFGILYGIRTIANALYHQDALGLGDVKLMGAAGLWLGPDGVLMAMTLGALCGMAHGVVMAVIESRKNHTRIDLARLSVPAGPGFALGILITGLYQYGRFWTGL